ncbi:MAG: hypothetical protein WA736_09800 [Candidatus Acidiferrum sp.]
MPSFTSAFEKLKATQAISLLLGLLLFYCSTLEVVTRTEFTRISRVQRRIENDKRAALALKPTTSDGANTFLLVGNSLLVHGVDPDKLHQEMAPGYYSAVLGIENTQYVDWYFGLRRFFAEGSRPAVIVLSLTTRQLISPGINGEYFAYQMMQERDILRVKRAAQLDTTMTSNLFFANRSAWLGNRSMIRNWLLGELMPSVDQLTAYLPEKAPQLPPDEVVIHQSLERLQGIKEVCKNNGARFIFVLPPVRGVSDLEDTLRTAAASAGIIVLVPYRGGEMPAAYFSDGFHLNNQGAALFTERLGLELVGPLSQN